MEKGNLMDLDRFVLNPATLLVLIFGLVEYVKGFGLQGNTLRLLSLFIGLSLAVAFKLRELYPPASVWIEIVFFGLAAGLAASGMYDFLKSRL